MRAGERYKIMREFRDKHKVGENINLYCPDNIFYEKTLRTRCFALCEYIFVGINGCPCHEFGCSTALRKLDRWLAKEKKRLGVK